LADPKKIGISAIFPGAYRYDHQRGNDDFTQAGDLFRLFASDAQQRLIHNIVMSMKSVPREIQARQIRHFLKVDVRYRRGVMEGLCCDPKRIVPEGMPEEVSQCPRN
jgi:catalase